MSVTQSTSKTTTLADGTDHLRLRSLRLGCEQIVAEAQWDHFCTLTFRFAVTELDAVAEFERGYVQRLQQRSQGRVTYFAVSARNWAHGRVHVHALLRFVRPILPNATKDAWRAGQASVTHFNHRRGANSYIARHVALPEAETMFRQ